MDPLVSCALWVQRQAARGAGTALGAALGAYLVWSVANRPPLSFDLAALGVGLALLGHAATRRLLRQPLEEEMARRDAALFTLLTVLCYAAVLRAPGGLGGPFYPVVYGLAMLVAS